MAKRWRESKTWRKHVTGYALNEGASVGTDHVKTRSCASRSRSMMDIRQQSPKAFGGKTCLPIAYAQWFLYFPPTEKQKCRSTGAGHECYHYARDFPKGLSSRHSSSCCTSKFFGEFNPETGRLSCLQTMLHFSTATSPKKSLKQPHRKP